MLFEQTVLPPVSAEQMSLSCPPPPLKTAVPSRRRWHSLRRHFLVLLTPPAGLEYSASWLLACESESVALGCKRSETPPKNEKNNIQGGKKNPAGQIKPLQIYPESPLIG